MNANTYFDKIADVRAPLYHLGQVVSTHASGQIIPAVIDRVTWTPFQKSRKIVWGWRYTLRTEERVSICRDEHEIFLPK
jgi:hypothetical protein